MPRHVRNVSAASQGHFAATQQLSASLGLSPLYSQPQRVPMAAASYYALPGSSASASMPLPPQPQPPGYDAYAADAAGPGPSPSPAPAPAVSLPPAQHRASSGAWSPQDDHQLVTARMQGLNWGQIKDAYFPSKTANACRKRHERLMERKSADDWDSRKLQRLAREYMGMRREIWSGLTARTGEKWSVVEQKCMSNGLKNLQSAARAASLRDRLETGSHVTGYDDDSGVSGIGLTPVDELDASYSSPEMSSSGPSSLSSSASVGYGFQSPPQHQHQHRQQQQQQAHLQPHGAYAIGGGGGGYEPGYCGHYGCSPGVGAASRRRYAASAASSAAAATHGGCGASQAGSLYLDAADRLHVPSSDMGIGAIINRPGGGRAS